MKEVLIITYYWPPASGAGVQRWLKLAKYLPAHGWRPVILTVRKPTAAATDFSLEEEIPDEAVIYKTRSLEPFALYNLLLRKKSQQVEEGMGDIKGERGGRLKKIANYIRSNYFVPDARMGWKPFALKMSEKLLKKHLIACIITTGPPHSTHLIGMALRKRTGIPWIADFRDPWTSVFYNQELNRTERAWKKDRRLEREVLEAADRILVVGKSMKEEFSPYSEKVSVLHNGFDAADFEPGKHQPDLLDPRLFNLSYVGNFKYLQNHPPLWAAIRTFLEASKERSSFFRLNFVGKVHDEVRSIINDYGLTEVVRYLGYRTHSEAIKVMKQSALLLFIISDTPGNEKLISGKVFEYLQSGTPIVSVGRPEGDADDILIQCGHRPMIPFGQKKEMTAALESSYRQWTEDGFHLDKIRTTAINRFDRSHQARFLSSLIEEINK